MYRYRLICALTSCKVNGRRWYPQIKYNRLVAARHSREPEVTQYCAIGQNYMLSKTFSTSTACNRWKVKKRLTKREQLQKLRQEELPVLGEHETGFDNWLPVEQNAAEMFESLRTSGQVLEDEASLKDIIVTFIKHRCDRDRIMWLFEYHPEFVRKYANYEWDAALTNLTKVGFFSHHAVRMIVEVPRLFNMSSEQLSRITHLLRQIFSTELRMCRVCIMEPALLAMSPEDVRDKYIGLSELLSKNQIKAMADLSPNMFIDDIQDSEQKLNYVKTVLNAPERHISLTHLFSHSMEHLIKRSEMLIKSGLYIKPDKHGHAPIQNPALQDIIDTSPTTFCRKIANCTIQEYETFCRMFDCYDERAHAMNEQVRKAHGYTQIIDDEGEDETPDEYAKSDDVRFDDVAEYEGEFDNNDDYDDDEEDENELRHVNERAIKLAINKLTGKKSFKV